MAQMQATQLVTSGLWGLLYYREIRGRAMLVWIAFALWTITAVVLLGMEKGGPSHQTQGSKLAGGVLRKGFSFTDVLHTVLS